MAVTWGQVGSGIKGVLGGQSIGDLVSTIANNNLAAAANQNVYIPVQNPSAVPAPGVTQSMPAIAYATTAGVKNYYWALAALGLGVLFIATRRR